MIEVESQTESTGTAENRKRAMKVRAEKHGTFCYHDDNLVEFKFVEQNTVNVDSVCISSLDLFLFFMTLV
jgi:hypothetical protein